MIGKSKSSLSGSRVADRNFELQDMSCARTLKDFLFWKLLPVGNLAEGPGIVWLLSAQFRHKFGRRIAAMQMSDDRLYKWMVAFLSRLRALLHRR